MQTKKRTFAALTTAAVLVAGAGLAASALTGGTAPADAGTSAVSTGLTGQMAQNLQRTREEERMSRDLYAALAKAHADAAPMSRITTSEGHHHDAVGVLLDRYHVGDPSAGRSAGSYAFPEIQKLYDGWYAEGKTSLKAAYQVGIKLEKWDIAGLEKDVATTSHAEVKQLYTNLLTASRHHLSAYEAAASGQPFGPGNGGPGVANHKGMGNGMGKGMGNRMGNGTGAWGHGQGQGPGGHGDCPMIDGKA